MQENWGALEEQNKGTFIVAAAQSKNIKGIQMEEFFFTN